MTDDLNAPPRLYKEVSVTIGEKVVTLVLRRAPKGLSAMVAAEAKRAGDMNEKGEPNGDEGALRFMARMAAVVVYRPDAVRPAYDRRKPEDLDRIIESEWLMELQDDIAGAFAHQGVALERIKGNSEATPTEP
jgi:hypothetical protein